MARSRESRSGKADSPTPRNTDHAQKPGGALATASPWTLCGLGRSTWYRLLALGRAPVGIRVTRKKRIWPVTELQRWLDNGGPDGTPAFANERRAP
jgi:hypothetical protein